MFIASSGSDKCINTSFRKYLHTTEKDAAQFYLVLRTFTNKLCMYYEVL